MRRFQIYSLSLPILALLVFAGNAAAQEKSSPLLSTLEVRQLVAHGRPDDHARLAGHFTALAEQYTTEAKRHTSMSKGFVGNPSRNLGTALGAHCRRLAELNTQSATAVRELAAHHQQLATGALSILPRESAGFEAGTGAPEPTDQQLEALAAKASTSADHLDLEAYFLSLAKRYTNDAVGHQSMAQAYRGLPRSPGGAAAAAVHCDHLVALSQAAAKGASKAAAMHKELAGVVR